MKESPQTFSEVLDQLKYNEAGLIPAIAQQHDTQEILMMAWMNRAAIEETLRTGQVCYWSRSRQAFWRKGESSGQKQRLHELRFDCDLDTVLLLVEQTGAACHTGRRHCFFYKVDAATQQVSVDSEPMIDPALLYGS